MHRFAPALTAGVLGGIGLLMVTPVDDLDVWWLLRSGQWMIETRSFPTVDPFSGTAQGARWLNHAWGFELLLYGAWAMGGHTGLILLQAAFAMATFGVLYRLLRREGVGQGPALAWIAVGGVATRGFWSPRPQLVTYLLLAVFWALLREHRDGRADRLWWLPLLTVVWVNFHGGFIIGPALIGLTLGAALLESAFRDDPPAASVLPRLLLVGLSSGVAALMNPFHYRALLFPFEVMDDRVARDFIIEWSSPPFREPQIMLVEALLLLTAALLLVVPRRGRWLDLTVLVVFTHLALHATRNVPLLVVTLLPIAGRLAGEADPRIRPILARLVAGSRASRVWAAALAVALLAVGGYAVPWRRLEIAGPRLGEAATFPTGAVEYLKRVRHGGTLFNDYGWGGYLIWHLFPDYRVSIDGRAAVYGPKRLADHVEIINVRSRWREHLAGLGVDLAVIRARSALAGALRVSPEWEILHEDRIAVVFGKRGTRS